MESGSDMSEDNLLGDPKFQRFASSIDRTLKGFEVTREWHDLISCLARLHKVFHAYTLPDKYEPLSAHRFSWPILTSRSYRTVTVVQEAVTVPPSQPTWWSTSQSNRCLQVRFSPIIFVQSFYVPIYFPSFPPYLAILSLSFLFRCIFDRIGGDGLVRDLFIYTSGLFPLLEYAPMQVRPALLDLYEQYIIPLGPGLLPALQGILLGLLPGLEEGSEYTDRYIYSIDMRWAVTIMDT